MCCSAELPLRAGLRLLHTCINVYGNEAHMSPSLSRSSALRCIEVSDALEIHDWIYYSMSTTNIFFLLFHRFMQTTPPFTSDPLSFKSPEPTTTTTTTSKPPTTKPFLPKDDDDDDLFSDPLLGSSGGPPPKLETKSQSKKPAANTGPLGRPLGTDTENDQLFSTSVKVDRSREKEKEKEREKLFSDDSLTASTEVPKKTQKVPKPTPKPKSKGLFDDDVSDDDLFSAPAPPPKKEEIPPPTQKKRLPGAVPIFGGIDPLAGRAQLGEGKRDDRGEKTREAEKKSRERNDLFGKNSDSFLSI